MICRLSLLLKGMHFISKEIELADDIEDLSFAENVAIRENQFNSAIEVMRIEHYRQIIKCMYDHCFVGTFQSKLNYYEPDFGGAEESG